MELRQFIWYATPDDFDEMGNLNIRLSAGRLRHRWVPTTKASAKVYLKTHEDAAGLRGARDNYILVTIIAREDSLFQDLTSDYPNAVVNGLRGAVIRVPFEEVLPKVVSSKAIERGVEEPAISYRSGRTDSVFTTTSKQVGELEMGLMTTQEIIDMSVMELVTPDSFTTGLMDPIKGGVQDMRMGTTNTESCETCDLSNSGDGTNSCHGHFGRISLSTPVPKAAYLGFSGNDARGTYPILNTLNRICFSCGDLNIPVTAQQSLEPMVDSLFGLNKRNFTGFRQVRNRVNDVYKAYHGTKPEQKKKCPRCDSFNPEIRFKHSSGQFYFPVPDDRYYNGAKGIDYLEAYEILQRIPDEMCKYLGLDPSTSRPEDLFFRVLPVAPNTARPFRFIPDTGMNDLSDLTKLYQDVIVVNERLRDIKIRNLKYSMAVRATTQLYHAVSRVYDNQRKAIGSGGTSQQRGFGGKVKNVSLKGVINRLTGKRGRFRNNLQSKYVEEVSYSVITPDPALSIDEVGVPIQVAMEATTLEVVTDDNKRLIRQLLLNGPNNYPGATTLYVDGDIMNKNPGNVKVVRDENGQILFERYLLLGSVIRRHIIDGDIGLFNRAPSLHRQSILAMRARVRPAKSLAMNPTVCIPFNADYDGDAMKLHFVQTPKAIEDAKKWMQLTKNIIHARYGKLTVATDQDQTSGLYLLTHTNKQRRNEWNPTTGLGFTDEGIPYLSKSLALQAYTYVFSEIRDAKEIRKKWLAHSKSVATPVKWKDWSSNKIYRTVNSLPAPDTIDGDGNPAYTGRAIFSHLFTVLDTEYVSATFIGNTPKVDDEGNIVYKDKESSSIDPSIKLKKKEKERIVIYKGKLIQGTLEKDSFGEGGASIAPSFIYHEGYEKGQEKLVEYIEMATRLGFAAHAVIGFTMGLTDVMVEDKAIKQDIRDMYELYSEKVIEAENLWESKQYLRLATTEDEKVFAASDPVGFIDEKIHKYTSEYEDRLLVPIENAQGAGNPMQIAVRSKARGKDMNVRQMCGSYGQTLVGGKRLRVGINHDRSLAHFPMKGDNGETYDLKHPAHSGFIYSSYSDGFEPTEYWFGSTGGRRSTIESGQGQIAVSGYLERKMIKALESLVVNDKKQVVNTRTGRVVSPIIGDDGLAPYHIRGSHKDTNKDGHIITLQPLLFEFECKHGYPLENVHTKEYSSHHCPECEGSNADHSQVLEAHYQSYQKFPPSNLSKKTLADKLRGRIIGAVALRQIAQRFCEFYDDSVCRTGEAIGATAGGCLGEPATQASLRTFHFAGKLSFQGSVDRTKQILESPLSDAIEIKNPRTRVPLREDYSEESLARKVASICRTATGEQIISLISYNLEDRALIIQFNIEMIDVLGLTKTKQIVRNQINKAVRALGVNFRADSEVNFDRPFVIYLDSTDKADFLRVKERIYSTKFSGVGNADVVYLVQPDHYDAIEGRYTLDIRDASATTLNNVVDRLNKYLEVEALQTNNIAWISKRFGMEAALWQIEQELDFQMNGGPGAKGVGEYDYRYVRLICDAMGEEGVVTSLGPMGSAGFGNYSVLAACSLERQAEAIMAGSVMGNKDKINGPAEAIVTGSTVSVGDYLPISD